MTTTKIFKEEILQNFADELKANGMKIFYSPYNDGRLSSYFFYTDGINIGYCQWEYFGGIVFSTVHKPCRECGTGFRISENATYEPTLNDAKKAFIIAPQWAKASDRRAVVKYKNWDEYNSGEGILKYVEY